MTYEQSSNPLRLYLIRHGEVEGAEAGRIYGRTDVPLSEKGIEQSRRLADRLTTVALNAVYSSDLSRTVATAEVIAAHHKLRVQPDPIWREIDMGQWDGLSLNDLYQQNEESIKQLFEHPESFQYPHGESFLAFNARIQTAMNELMTTHGDGEIALVTHGGVARAIIGTALEMPMRRWLGLSQEYGCLNIIDWYGPNAVIHLLNHH